MRYDWVVVGGGIAGISVAEILAREGKRVVLIEQNDTLAGETTKGFHEWIHTGSLYTLVPDNLRTLKFLMGAIDDLLEYYSAFDNMNVRPTEAGLAIDPGPNAWFYDEHIVFKYRLRRWNLPWLALVSRSDDIIRMIKRHDWLRRRGGVLDRSAHALFVGYVSHVLGLATSRREFFELTSPDFTTNSRNMLADLVATAVANGLEIQTGAPVRDIVRRDGASDVITSRGTIQADRVVLCCGRRIRQFADVEIKTSYAPIAIVRGLEAGARSFVHLDYHTKTCINLLVKPNGIGQAGGITLNKRQDCDAYLAYVIGEHRKVHPRLEVLGSYIGEKDEITFKGQNRNYLYHIVECADGLWSAVPGKYTLGFSLAPEFYRRIYKKNPVKFRRTVADDGRCRSMIADTFWQELGRRPEMENTSDGND